MIRTTVVRCLTGLLIIFGGLTDVGLAQGPPVPHGTAQEKAAEASRFYEARDFDAASQWFLAACKDGDKKSCDSVEMVYAWASQVYEHGVSGSLGGPRIPRNYARALEWAKRGAAAGYDWSMLLL